MVSDLRQQATDDWSLRERAIPDRESPIISLAFCPEALSRSQTGWEVETPEKSGWTFGETEAAGTGRTLARRELCRVVPKSTRGDLEVS